MGLCGHRTHPDPVVPPSQPTGTESLHPDPASAPLSMGTHPMGDPKHEGPEQDTGSRSGAGSTGVMERRKRRGGVGGVTAG